MLSFKVQVYTLREEPRRAIQGNESPTVEIQMSGESWEVSLTLNLSSQESADYDLNSTSKYLPLRLSLNTSAQLLLWRVVKAQAWRGWQCGLLGASSPGRALSCECPS